MSATTRVSKSDIRQSTLALRQQLTKEALVAQSRAIAARLLKLPQYRQASAVLGYMNFGTEFASELLIPEILVQGKKLALPRVNHHTNELDLFWVEDTETQLGAGLWGIREPIVERCKQVAALNEVEFVLLPGVAFTGKGARLGYGRGFYDKLLARMTHRPALVAAAFELQMVEQIPQETTDVNVEWIITERRTINCAAPPTL